MLVEVGQILKPRGLKGELKVAILFNRPLIFNELKTVFIGDKQYNVNKGSVQNGFAYLNLQGVDTLERAELLRNQMVSVADVDLHLQADEVLSSTLIGFAVWQNGIRIGTVTSVENYGGGDFFEIALTGKGYARIPNEDEFIAETNLTQKSITLTARALEEELL